MLKKGSEQAEIDVGKYPFYIPGLHEGRSLFLSVGVDGGHVLASTDDDGIFEIVGPATTNPQFSSWKLGDRVLRNQLNQELLRPLVRVDCSIRY